MSLKEDIKHLQKNPIVKVNEKLYKHLHSMYEVSIGDTSKEQINDVFNRYDFKEHIKKTAMLLNKDEAIVEKVVKHYLSTMIKYMNLIHEYRTRVSIYGLFKVEFNNYFYRLDKEYHFARYSKNIIGEKKYNNILKFIKSNYLKLENYEQRIQQQRTKPKL